VISPSSSNLPVNPLLEAVLPEAPLLPRRFYRVRAEP